MQNRAIEGDEVALQILPPTKWFISGSMIEKGKAKLQQDANSPVSASPIEASPLAADVVSSSPGLSVSPLGSASTSGLQRCILFSCSLLVASK